MITNKAPVRHLVTDEVIGFGSRMGAGVEARIRIWRGKDATPVVLSSQVSTGPEDWRNQRRFTCKIANYVQSAVLGHPEAGLLYFEDEVASGGARALSLVHFEFFGHTCRLKLFMPVRQAKSWDWFESALGGEVEH